VISADTLFNPNFRTDLDRDPGRGLKKTLRCSAECFPAAATVVVYSPALRKPERRAISDLRVGEGVQVSSCKAGWRTYAARPELAYRRGAADSYVRLVRDAPVLCISTHTSSALTACTLAAN
jgi:hypothetical protein